MFKEYLLSAKNNNIPVTIYSNSENTQVSSFGLVQGVSDDWVLLASFSLFGFYAGFIIIKHEDVFRCESKNKYSERLLKLYQLRKQKHPIVDLTSGNLLRDLIQYAQKNQLVVTIELRDSGNPDLIGFIGDIKDDLITIDQIDFDGNADGDSVISFEDITRVDCDTEAQMSLKLLTDNR